MNDAPTNRPPDGAGFNGNDSNQYENLNTMEIEPKRNRRPIIAVMVILIGVVVLLGFYVANVLVKLNTANAEAQKANQDLATSRKDLKSLTATRETEQANYKKAQQTSEEQIAGLESALQSTETAVGELRDEQQQATKELTQFKAFSAQFKRMIDAGKLEVVFRRGRMVVNLPAQVLFDSGSADLSAEGNKALEEVAKVLRTVKNKRFVVGGHTDDQKIKRAKFESNWELSTARALVVTEAMIKAGLKPWNLIAAGYSQYAPIASNKNEEGRQKNRRIEIILEPYLKNIKPPKEKSKPTESKKKAAAKGKHKKK